MVFAQCCINLCLRSLGQTIISYGREDYHMICTMIHCLPQQCLRQAIGVHNFLFFQWDGVSPAIIYDDAKEKILGEFNRKLKEVLYHLRQMEPFTPWSNTAKREIKKLKKESCRKLIKSGTPKGLFDDCLELESYI